MSLVDVDFAFWFPVVFGIYWLLPRKASYQNAVLLGFSYLFYFSWNPRLLPLLLLATAVDYGVSEYLATHAAPSADDSSPEAAARRRARRRALALSLVYNLGALAYFKYAGFFAESLNQQLALLGFHASLPVLKVILPLGISFYTLQKLGYIFDVYRGRLEPCRSVLVFGTFVAFFPQVIAGPISRGSQLIPQLASPRTLRERQIVEGASAFLLGYILKAFVADTIGPAIVDPVFANPGTFGVGAHWYALVGYAVQVFADFGGYSFLAIGCARFLGIELPLNFDYPYLSKSLPEMWRRWHITLNRWLFDYIYDPLVGGTGWWRGRFDAGLTLVFLASGLWHGARATFILWGAMHAVGMVVQRHWDEYYRGLCRRDRSYVERRRSLPYRTAAWTLTQGFFLLALVPFRAGTWTTTTSFASGLLSGGEGFPVISQALTRISVPIGLAFVVLYHLSKLPRIERWWTRFLALPAPVRGMVYGLVVAWLLLFVPLNATTFIYRQF